MAGEKVLASLRNETSKTIDNARTRYGLGATNSTVSSGDKTNASDYNNLVNWLTEAKNKAGASSVGIEGHVDVGTILQQSKLSNLLSQANAIYNYCTCHGQCTGSCTGSCSGSCTGSCTGGCSGGCRDSCGNTCQMTCGGCNLGDYCMGH